MARVSRDAWWKHAVFYQIYPLSFSDSNGDGFGDLRGVIDRLDYLTGTLGVDAVWLSPFFKSPMRDWGYDVSDHTDVDPSMGDLDTFRELMVEARKRDLRVIVDLVINHTSDQHPWFLESRESKASPQRDWYVWRNGRDGGPPNNWKSVFSGPAWTRDEATGQWYRHTYLAEQPDLNWRNPEVVDAMTEVARFWLDLGVDGFRVDAAHQMMKDPRERDNPPAPPGYPRVYKDMGEYDEFIHLYDFGHPDVHGIHRHLRSVVDSVERDAVTIGEIHIFDLPEWASYYGEDLDQLHMPFNFHLLVAPWEAPSIRAVVESVLWNVPAGGWTNWTLGNHDEIRLASRLPDGSERLAALLLLTLRGTPFLYYGDEIGMRQAEVPPGSARDPWGRRVDWLSRDGARTPMQWTGGANAGFGPEGSSAWLPIGPEHERLNVESQMTDPTSILALYRRLLQLRKDRPALRIGSYLSHPASSESVFAYRRESDAETLTVVLNLSSEEAHIDVGRGSILLSTSDPDRTGTTAGNTRLGPLEGLIIDH